MLDERKVLDQEVSRHYCEFRYGHYGIFASLPLLTAVLETQTYGVDEFRSATNAYSHKSSLSEFINGLTYAGKDYFTIEESLFLLRLINLWKPVKDEQLEADLSGLARQGGSVILQSHAKALIKAVNFWKMNYNDKREEWRRKYVDADVAFVTRRRARIGSVGRETHNIRDEGYESGHDQDSDLEDYYYGSFDDDDEDDDDEDEKM